MKKRTRFLAAMLATIVIVGAAALLSQPREWRSSFAALGTRVSVTFVGRTVDIFSRRFNGLARIVGDEIASIDRLMSVYKLESDIGRLNRKGGREEVTVDARTFEVLDAARAAWGQTDGAFNIFVLPDEQAWGFKTGGKRGVPAGTRSLPPHDLKDMALRIDGAKYTARFLVEGMRADLGGIAKGYAVDRAVKELKRAGVNDALVDIGGDCYCAGTSAAGTPWRIGVRHPRGSGVVATLNLTDMAVATSGDYEDYFIQDGRRYSHIFDPRTGRPAATDVISVNVIADSCMIATVLAKVPIVLGSKEGAKIIRRVPGAEYIIIVEGKDGLSMEISPGAERFMK